MEGIFISEPPRSEDDTAPFPVVAQEWELVLTCEPNPFAPAGHEIRFNMTADEHLARHLFDAVKAGYANSGYVFKRVSADEWKGTHFKTEEVIRLKLIQPIH